MDFELHSGNGGGDEDDHLNIHHSSEEDISLLTSHTSHSNSTMDIIGTSTNEVFEIRDFSTLSSWEKLIDKFEHLIQAWFNRFSNFQFTPTETFFYKSHVIQFNGTKYLFSYYNFNNQSSKPSSTTSEEELNSSSNNQSSTTLKEEEHDEDFLHRTHHLTRWFGVKEFFIISLYKPSNSSSSSLTNSSPSSSASPSSSSASFSSSSSNNNNNNNQSLISIQSSTSLSSAISVSLSNLNKNDIPYFILLNTEQLKYNGRLNSKNNQITKYKSECLYEKEFKYLTSSFLKLSGIIDLFCINIGTHVRITNELTIKSRYTYIVKYLNSKEWLKIKDDFNFTKSERNLLFTIGTKQDPIQNFQFSCIFNSINMNEPNIDNLNIKNAHFWEIKLNSLKLNEFELSSKLKLFINSILLNQEITINSNSNYINEIIYDIFETTSDELFQIKSKLNEKDLIKSCLPNSLLRRFCDHILRIKSKQDLKLLWKLFIKVLFKYWEESNNLNEFPENISFIPFTNLNVNWSTCLIEQKIDLLNICCLKQIEIKNSKLSKNSNKSINKSEQQEEELDEWKDSGFETLSDISSSSDHSEYFDIEDDSSEEKENILKIIEISGREIKIPKTQNSPQLTEDLIEEQREILSNLNSSDQRIRFQCEGLISDMQAFKFVNPGCEFSDFLLWYSPKDVEENNNLSTRMKMNENIWKQFWEESKPLPISKQKQIFDHKLQAEKIIHQIEMMDFDIVLQQLMICTLSGHYYMLKEWWVDIIMESTDIFSSEFKQVDKKLDSNLPLIRIIEKKFSETRNDLKLLSNRLTDNNLMFKCCDHIQDLELNISLIMSLISKITIQGKKSFMEVYNSSKCLLNSLEDLIINSKDYIKFNNATTSENIHEGISEFLLDQDNNNTERVSEYILRCTAQRPYLISQPTRQLMYALISSDEIRVSTALTEKVPW